MRDCGSNTESEIKNEKTPKFDEKSLSIIFLISENHEKTRANFLDFRTTV